MNNLSIEILRCGIYIWVCIEAILGAYVYLRGYKNIKTKKRAWESPIIVSLILMLLSIAIFAGYAFIIGIIRIFRPESYTAFTFWVPLSYIPIGYTLDRFRQSSLSDEVIIKKVK